MLWAVLAASLVGSAHCAAMCGPLAAAAAGCRPRGPSSLGYHGGRLAVYVTLGAIAGGVGAALDLAAAMAGGTRIAAQIAGWLLVALGVASLLRQTGLRAGRLHLGVPALGMPVAARIRRAPPAARGLALGLATGLLPCGWLYAFLAVAAGTGSAGRGALAMGVFWAGTVPAVAAAGLAIGRAAGPLRRRLPALGAAALVVIGLVTVGRGGTGHASGHGAAPSSIPGPVPPPPPPLHDRDR